MEAQVDPVLRDGIAACFADSDSARTWLEGFARARGLDPALPPPPTSRKALVEAALARPERVTELVAALGAEHPERREDLEAALARWQAATTPAPSAEPLQAGATLDAGRYRLERELGRGAFARVWLAQDTASGQPVALKVLRPERAQDRSARERLFAGARRMAALEHPFILRILRERVESEGLLYLVMEYCPGGDLAALFADSGPRDRPFKLLLEVAQALEHAHQQGVLHRDVKPQNILLGADGHARLADFDLSKGAGAESLTLSAEGLGSMIYAAPEQQQGAAGVDARADVYSLGMTTLCCANGGRLDVSALHERDAVIDALAVPAALRALLRQATALRPAERPPSAAAFAQALHAALSAPEPAPQPAHTAPAPVAEPPQKTAPKADPSYNNPVASPHAPRRAPRLLVGGGLALAVALGLGLWALGPAPAQPEPTPPEPTPAQPEPTPEPEPEPEPAPEEPPRGPTLALGAGAWGLLDAAGQAWWRPFGEPGVRPASPDVVQIEAERQLVCELSRPAPGAAPGEPPAGRVRCHGADGADLEEAIDWDDGPQQLSSEGSGWCVRTVWGHVRCSSGLAGPPPGRYAALDLGPNLACGITLPERRLACTDPALGSGPLSGDELDRLAVGAGYACALTLEGALRCFGKAPAGVPTEGSFLAVAAQGERLCALDAEGRAGCWGRYRNRALSPPTGAGFVALDLEDDRVCTLHTDGSVTCRTAREHERCAPGASGWTCAPVGS